MANIKQYVYYDKSGEIYSVSEFQMDVKDCKMIETTKVFNPSEYCVEQGKLKKLKVGLSTQKTETISEPSDEEKYLFNTDWKVTRHRDQIELGVETSLNSDEYRKLLEDRQKAREIIAGGN